MQRDQAMREETNMRHCRGFFKHGGTWNHECERDSQL